MNEGKFLTGALYPGASNGPSAEANSQLEEGRRLVVEVGPAPFGSGPFGSGPFSMEIGECSAGGVVRSHIYVAARDTYYTSDCDEMVEDIFETADCSSPDMIIRCVLTA